MTERTVFMFPGQGSQYVGMRRTSDGVPPVGDALWQRAEDVLDLPLRRLADEGPPDELTRTSHAQPALLVAGIAAAQAMETRGIRADIVLGHSLGEYGALVHAGALTFDDALRLVRARGLLMEQAAAQTPGGMIAVIGASQDALRPVIEEIAGAFGVLEITNINAPAQLVVSGEEAALDAISEQLRQTRLGRGIRLDVSAPFHCSLMAGAAAEFSEVLDRVEIRSPTLRFIDNVTGAAEDNPDRIRQKLVAQISSPVLWSPAVETAWADGGRLFVECGPKAVLGGLVKRTIRAAKIISSERTLSTPSEPQGTP